MLPGQMEMAAKVKCRTSFVTFCKTKIRKIIGGDPSPLDPPSRYTPEWSFSWQHCDHRFFSFLTILTWRNLCFTEFIQYKNSLKYKVDCFWRFYMFTHQLCSFNFIIVHSFNPLSYRRLKNVTYQIDSKN